MIKTIKDKQVSFKKQLSFSFLVKQVPGQAQEQRESEKTALYLQIIIILISYIIIYYHQIIN